MGKNKARNRQSPGAQKAKGGTPQPKNMVKQVQTPKSAPTKKVTKHDISSEDSDSCIEDFEALLKGPQQMTPKETKKEKIPQLVPIKQNGNKGGNVKKDTPKKAQVSGKPETENKTPGKAGMGNKTPGKATVENKSPGKALAGQKTPEVKMTSAANSAQKKPVITPSMKDNKKKRTHQEMEDSSDEEEETAPKIAKTSSSPAKTTPKKTESATKTSPVKRMTPEKKAQATLAQKDDTKSQPKVKTPMATQNKKRAREEADEEEELDDAEETNLTKKAKVTANETKNKTNDLSDAVTQDTKFQVQVAKCSLFIKNLGDNVTEKDITALSPDILDVQLRHMFSKKAGNQCYGFLRFKDEKTAEANHKLLANKKIHGNTIVVDYVGDKSQIGKLKTPAAEDLDFTRLYIRGFGNMDETGLKKLFQKADSVTVPLKKKDGTPIGYAFVGFKNEADCKEAHDEMQGKDVDGKLFTVYYAKKSTKTKPVPALLQSAKANTASTAVAKSSTTAKTVQKAKTDKTIKEHKVEIKEGSEDSEIEDEDDEDEDDDSDENENDSDEDDDDDDDDDSDEDDDEDEDDSDEDEDDDIDDDDEDDEDSDEDDD